MVETTTEVYHNWAIRHVIFTTLEYHVFDNRTFDIVEWILWLPFHSATRDELFGFPSKLWHALPCRTWAV